MDFVDLTEAYRDKLIKENDRTAYENSFPELFNHYYEYWAKRNFEITYLNDSELKIRGDWIRDHVRVLKAILRDEKIDTSYIDIVLMVGVKTSNGHAFRHNGRFYVWLPLETYNSEKLVKVFVTHELVHALHYYHNQDFYFESVDERNVLSRQLITEGMATYLTKRLLGVSDTEALWGDYLRRATAASWLEECRRREKEIFALIRKYFYSSSPEYDIFTMSDPDDILKYRAGYYAGLRLVEEVAEGDGLTGTELLTAPRNRFEERALSIAGNI